MEKVEFPEELVSFFENIEQRSTLGIAPTERAKWAQNLSVPRFSEKEGYDYLLYTGAWVHTIRGPKKVSSSLVEILNNASVSFGILGSDEMCCGDAMRRLGNEYIFDKIAGDNVRLFKKMGVKRLSPHVPTATIPLRTITKSTAPTMRYFTTRKYCRRL